MLDKYQQLLVKLKTPSQIKTELKTLYQTEYEENFETILIKPEKEFLSTISLYIKSSIIDQYSQKAFENFTFTSLFKSIESSFTKQTYSPDKQLLLKWLTDNNLHITPSSSSSKSTTMLNTNFPFLKHCNYQNNIPLHHCSSTNQFILIHKDNSIYGAYCKRCKCVYKAQYIKLYCNFCNLNYYSCIETNASSNMNNNLQPATWEKYHCHLILNEQMKCIQCKGLLFIDIKSGDLVCNRCKFTSNPNNIIWKCLKCSEEFNSNAKIYNPYEYKPMAIAIKKAMFHKQFAAPKVLPCGHEGRFVKHKKECQGELYLTYLNERKMVLCNKCKGLTKYEKFIWVCSECNRRFRDVKGNGVLSDNSSSNTLGFGVEGSEMEGKKKTKNFIKNNERILSSKNILKSTLGIDVKEKKIKTITPKMSTTSLVKHLHNSGVPVPTNKSRDNLSNTKLYKNTSNKNNRLVNTGGNYVGVRGSNISNTNFNTIQYNHNNKHINISNDASIRGDDNNNNNNNPFEFLHSLGQRQMSLNNNNNNSNTKIRNNNNKRVFLPIQLTKNKNIPIRFMYNNNNVRTPIIPSFDINKYDLISQISQGTTSKILCVKEQNTFNFYAMKKKEFTSNINKSKTFHNLTIQYKCSKQTAYIVPIIAINESNDEINILQELGINNLSSEIATNRKMHKIYDEPELIKVIYQITEAMIILNENGYTHFNIQPRNIILFNEDNIQYKLCDFDNIKDISHNSNEDISFNDLTLTHFVSPQRYAFAHYNNDNNNTPITNKDFDLSKSDVYSLGLVVIYMLMLTDDLRIFTNDFISFDYSDILNDSDYIKNMVTKYLNMSINKTNKNNKHNKHYYSNIFVDMLCRMLHVDECKRFSFKEIKQYILKYYK